MQQSIPDQSGDEQAEQRWEDVPVDTFDHWKGVLAGIPLPPASFGDIARNANSDNTAEQWVELIVSDPVLSGKILAVVNCAALGLTKPMTDLQRAVVHLGGNITRIIVIGYYIEGLLGKWDYYPRQHFEFVRKWGAAASILTNHFAKAAKLADPGTLSTAALLSRLGSFILALEWPGPKAEYMQQTDELARLDYELTTWRITSPALGGMTAEHWGLPEPIPKLIKQHLRAVYHELPASAENAERALISAAVVIAASLLQNSDTSLDKVLYEEHNERLLGNLSANNLLDKISGVWDRKQVKNELTALVE